MENAWACVCKNTLLLISVYKNTSQGMKFLSFLVPSPIFCKSPDICDKSYQPSLLCEKFVIQCAYFTREIDLILGSCYDIWLEI